MKAIKKITWFLGLMISLFVLLVACGGQNNNTVTRVTTPTHTTTSYSSVRLQANNMGSISKMDFYVSLPSSTKHNLLDYNGDATIKGSIQASSAFECLKTARSFNCKAKVYGGRIYVQNCTVGKNTLSMQIDLFRGQKLKESYSVVGLQVYTDNQCYYPQ